MRKLPYIVCQHTHTHRVADSWCPTGQKVSGSQHHPLPHPPLVSMETDFSGLSGGEEERENPGSARERKHTQR